MTEVRNTEDGVSRQAREGMIAVSTVLVTMYLGNRSSVIGRGPHTPYAVQPLDIRSSTLNPPYLHHEIMGFTRGQRDFLLFLYIGIHGYTWGHVE
jgi:hypothetical protein